MNISEINKLAVQYGVRTVEQVMNDIEVEPSHSNRVQKYQSDVKKRLNELLTDSLDDEQKAARVSILVRRTAQLIKLSEIDS